MRHHCWQEAFAIAELALVIDRPDVAAVMRARGESFARLIAAHLWDNSSGIFVNLFPNGTFYPRVSPTSFYPLQVNGVCSAKAKD